MQEAGEEAIGAGQRERWQGINGNRRATGLGNLRSSGRKREVDGGVGYEGGLNGSRDGPLGEIPARWFIGLGFLGHFVATDIVAFIYCHGEIWVKVACGGEDLNIHPFIICKGDDGDGSALIAIGHQDIAAV